MVAFVDVQQLPSEILQSFSGISHLSSGGQKSVYAAAHQTFGPVVLKVGIASSAAKLARITREVEALKEIASNYFPRQLDFQLLGGSRFLIVEERVEGTLLSAMLGRPWPTQKALDATGHLLAGLQIIWHRGIIHRDLKPDNIIIRPSGVPCVLDLGIARMTAETSLTETVALMGPCTPHFASPEQLTNRKAGIDFRTDQFALGILLYSMMVGHHPYDPAFVGVGDSIIENILGGRYAADGLALIKYDQITGLVNKLLGAEPFLRFRTISALEDAFRRCVSQYEDLSSTRS